MLNTIIGFIIGVYYIPFSKKQFVSIVIEYNPRLNKFQLLDLLSD